MRSLVFLAVVCFFAPSVAAAQAYLLKIEETGYNRVVSEKETPQSEPGPSIELLVRPDEPFTLRLESSDKKMEISGLLRVSDGVHRLEWSADTARRDTGPETKSDDPRVSELRTKLAQLEQAAATSRGRLTYELGGASTDAAVKEVIARLSAQDIDLDRLRRELAELQRNDGVAEVRLELGKAQVISSVVREVAKGDGLWQKFRRETKVTLRPTAANTARAITLDIMRQRAVYDRNIREQIFPAGFHDHIHEGMMIDAIQHEYRIQKRIHDQKYLPTTFEHNKIDLDSPIRNLVPGRRRN